MAWSETVYSGDETNAIWTADLPAREAAMSFDQDWVAISSWFWTQPIRPGWGLVAAAGGKDGYAFAQTTASAAHSDTF